MAEPQFPVTGIGSNTLTVTGVEPASGPYSGGTAAVIRGSGFGDGVVVSVGGVPVDPSDIVRDGKNRITIVVPAGMVGPADVTVTQGPDTATLPDGYMYNALAVSPSSGSIAGGSLVELSASGASFAQDGEVLFDGVPCTELKIESPQRATCKTPAHMPGKVEVTARPGDAGGPVLVAVDGYEYLETINAAGGGLSGGPIDGTLNVTIVDDSGGHVIPGALVLVGNDPKTALRGITDARGTVTFSAPDLHGPVTIHVSAKCFERTSIVSFDAQNATIFLSPTLDLSCASEGSLSPGAKQLVATVAGQLIFPGIKEFDVNSWDIVPKPRDNEIRVAYVYTTQSSLSSNNPPPTASGGDMARLVEDSAQLGDRGYLYRIAARPGGLAVYALCGIERLDDHQFTPYVTGVAHNVVTSPGEETQDVDIQMTITLDREFDVELSGYPAATADGPTEFSVAAFPDLGGEGMMVRAVNGTLLDVITRHTGTEPFRFFAQPSFSGALANATYFVHAKYYSTDVGVPYTDQTLTGVSQSSSPLRVGGFLGIPQTVAPSNGGVIPEDRTLRFSLDGPEPDLFIVDISSSDNSAWTEFLPGDVREVPVPDLSQIDGQSDLPPGFFHWTVTAVKIDGFAFNEFQYSALSRRYWTHSAANEFFARR